MTKGAQRLLMGGLAAIVVTASSCGEGEPMFGPEPPPPVSTAVAPGGTAYQISYPPGPGPHGYVSCTPGGGFTAYTPMNCDLMESLALAEGVAWVRPSYPVSAGTVWPAQVDALADVYAALTTDPLIDISRGVWGGISAGALVSIQFVYQRQPAGVVGTFAVAGPTCLYCPGYLSPGGVASLLAGSSESTVQASPLSYVDGDEPDAYLRHCSTDQAVDVQNARTVRDSLEHYGATVDYAEICPNGHAFPVPSDFYPLLASWAGPVSPPPPPADDPPVAIWTWSCVARTCTFDGSGSTDDVGIVSYEWVFNGNVIRTVPVFTFVFDGPFSNQLTLRVTDTVGQQDSDTQTVVVS